ncbi:MAG: hypothetical protein ABI835_09930 [Chloroflexota bacterium]
MTNELDDELAEITYALLSGRDVKVLSTENAELADVVRELIAVIDPQSAPSAEFQQRLTERLSSEWDRASAPPRLRLLDRPVVRLASLAAAVVLVLGALIVLAVPETTPQLQGMALPLDDAAAIFVLAGVAGVGAVVYWRSRR